MGRDVVDLRTYVPEPTARRFHGCDDFVRGILGPVGCWPAGTEFMTPGGWKSIERYQPGDAVLGWDPKTGEARFEEPLAFVDKEATQWVRFTRRGFDVTMSDDHRMPVNRRFSKWKRDGWRQVSMTALELAGLKSPVKLISTFSVPDGEPVHGRSGFLLRYAVAVNADGHVGPERPGGRVPVRFGFAELRKAARMETLLRALGLEYSLRTCSNYKGSGADYYSIRVFDSPYAGKTFDSPFFWGLGASGLRIVVDELQHWGGRLRNRKSKNPLLVFDTTREADAGFIQYAAAATGRRSTVGFVPPAKEEHKPLFRIRIMDPGSRKAEIGLRRGGVDVTVAPSRPLDRKYCFTMPSGYFIVRQNNHVLVSRNSGKSVACCMEAFTRAAEMPPCRDGVRRSRWAFIRNSYPELISTTMNTWKDWVPEKLPSGAPFCSIRRTAPIVATIDNVTLPDTTRMSLEVHFLALDKDEDVRKLKSLELTGVFLNEASELSEEVLKMATTRVGRYPAKVDLPPGTEYWTGVVMDTNPPSDDHWWYRLAEKERPRGYRFFRQPPAMLPVERTIVQDGAELKIVDWVPNQGQDPRYPAAENIGHHVTGFRYYENLVAGKDVEWARVYVMGEYGTLSSGRPVYPEFRHAVHVAKEELQPLRGLPVVCGLDYGLNHSAALLQVAPTGQVRLLDEIVTENCGSRRFAEEYLRPLVASAKYAGCHFVYTGDPAGNQKAQTDEATCISILRDCGFYVEQAQTNNFVARREAVAKFLTMLVDGKPGLLVSPTCQYLVRGFISGYAYRKMKLGGLDNRFAEKPDKNIYSHPHDALQYACLRISSMGAGMVEDPFSGSVRVAPAKGRARREVRRVDADRWT